MPNDESSKAATGSVRRATPLQIRLTPDDLELVGLAAIHDGLPTAVFARAALVAVARQRLASVPVVKTEAEL